MSRTVKKSVRLPAHINPLRYKLTLRPDLEKFTFTGEETIELQLDKTTKEITLHSSEIEIESAEFVHENKDTWAGKISYDEKAETATLAFPKTLPKGKGHLNLAFKGILNDKMRGFYRSRYSVDGQEKYMATTQFESTDARRAFPCFDEPSKKAVFDVTLMVPPTATAISNTVESNVWEHESGYKVVEFAPTPKMSTYLLAFIVGDFEYLETKTKRGVTVRIFVTPGKKHQAEFAVDVTAKIIDFYEDYFDIEYPLPVMDMIAIPDFSAGAMENWGAVTYRETALLIDPQNSSSSNKQRVTIVIAHELAHKWFGNLVTMEWWTHLWLNEGFASYMEYLAADSLFPEWDLWTQFVYLDQGSALELDSLANTHPIEVEVHHPDEISEIFDAVSYSKGSSIIRMLANYIGPTNFRDGLRKYLKKHQYSNATTVDLWDAFEQVSKKPIAKIMSNWTSKPGYPILTLEEGDKNLTISQRRYFSSVTSQKNIKDTTLWSVPVQIKTKKSKPETILLDKKSTTIPKLKEGEWLKLNADESSVVRVDYPAKYLHLLEEPLLNKELGATDRLGLIRDAFDLSEAGQLSTHEALKLAQSYQNEDDYTVWAEVASGLGKVDNLIAKETFAASYKPFARQIFEQIAQKLGWDKKSSDSHTQILLRSLALYNYGSYGDTDTIKKAQQIFENSTKTQIDPNIRPVVYNLVAENGGTKEYDALLELYKATDFQQEKDRILRALSLFKTKALLSKTLKLSLSEDVRPQDAVFVIAMVAHNPEGREIAWEFIKENWPVLKEKYAGGHFLLPRLVESLNSFTTKEALKDIKSFYKKNPSPEINRTLLQALEKIESNITWLKRDSKGIEKFLKNS